MSINETEEIYIADPKADYENIKIFRLFITYMGNIKMRRNEPCLCGSGIKTKYCHPNINEDSLVARILEIYSQLDLRNKNTDTLCDQGCSYCCADDFEISFSEFLVILDYFNTKRSRIRDKNRRNIAKDIINKGDIYLNKCLFLDERENMCEIYAVRPVVCRNYGTVKQGTEMPCKLMQATNFDTNNLLDEEAYESIDITTNFIKITGRKQKVISGKVETIAVWLDKLDENGVLKSERLRNLLHAATNHNIDYFIETMTGSAKNY